MKKHIEIFIAILIILFMSAVTFSVYRSQTGKQNRELAKRIAELSPNGGTPETIDGLKTAIALYEDQIERNVREGVQTGAYWKILATRLADSNMHNDALNALERAIYFNSEDPFLYYLAGVTAANVANSVVGFSADSINEKERYFRLSENSYKRALELNITYAKPMYGIALLYVFDLDRPGDAIMYLERLLQVTPADTSAMFVLARAYYMIENLQKAVEIYDKIAERTKDKNIREEALNNIDIIQEMLL
ncbi:MAG: tetratricopeptide repeat protein [Treponema sp.]|jgi:tetratricopeptide (TPR) repeat protein|nr:tetratricopeptide repeat protein [Treponema sp.]